jgi:hypothetical protein
MWQVLVVQTSHKKASSGLTSRRPIYFFNTRIFGFRPSIPSSIHGWHHHTGQKSLAEINCAPTPPLRMCRCLGKACPALVFYRGQVYVAISQVTSAANIKIFSGQGPHGYMRNVVYREVLEM